MNKDYARFVSGSPADREDIFRAAGQRIGTPLQNIEKDFWVCWTLDALFNNANASEPRLLFKGGTSLSKGFGLIERFSEDIDVTVFRDDIGEEASVSELQALSGKKRQAKLDAIKAACQDYIGGPLLAQLSDALAKLLQGSGVEDEKARVELDTDDESLQSLLLWYPTVTDEADGYVRKAVKIESGAKSALDPHHDHIVEPYLAEELPDLDFKIPNVRIVDAERTMWDKIVILHGLRQWFETRGVLRAGGQRVSRHYYDVHMLMKRGTADAALADPELGEDCVDHARMFFNSPALGLGLAVPGNFTLLPTKPMIEALTRDYDAMAGMIFGETPAFADVLESVAALESQLNKAVA